ncbi:MAG: glycoside hydrolase family 127 protein [Lachnospiraceae bacterium]|nr:glycoside hydrolase family 127 protein [Lachnospiraceae bacterium]MCM1237994.1 glycoside hydrolase family 127 protein [Lachnospiraceae bacterium]
MNSENFSSPLDLKQIQITDSFWEREQELVRREVIPYQWEALNDRVPGASPSYCMRNFKAAGKLMREKRARGSGFVVPTYTFRGFEALPEDPDDPDPDRFYGFVFQDSDLAKWIEAVGYSLMNHPDPELERTADEAIEIICAAQAENGYLDTYYIINGMDRIFTNLRDHHELYCFGHLVEGAVSYYQATGKDRLLKAVRRYADLIADRFGPEEGKCKGYPGHEIAEMALARLYEVTGEQKYLDLGRFFLEMRGTKPYYFDIEEKERAEYEGRPYKEPQEELRFRYHQAHLPVRQQTEAVGHAVRAVYLYSGMADVARLTGDEAMYAACERLWDSIVNEKLYITGGIGGTHLGEAFSYPYDLPDDTAYSETCAAIGLAFFARRMLEIRADNRYGDVMEQAIYNTVLAGMALDGKSFFYVNPLEVVPEACEKDERKHHVKIRRQKWFGCACCPPNIARIVSSLGAYAYTDNETTLYTHLYVGSSVGFALNGHAMDMQVETDFPWEGEVKITLHDSGDGRAGGIRGMLAFRIPGWCGEAQAEVRRDQCTLSSWGMKNGDIVSDGKKLSLEGTDWKAMMAGGSLSQAVSGSPGQTAEQVIRFPESPDNIDGKLQDGYLYLSGEWRDQDEIYLSFSMEPRCVRANTKVREDIGKVAFLRGPVCYCMEEADNGKDLHLFRADTGRLREIRVERSYELGHEMRILKVPGHRQEPSAEGAGLYTEFSPPQESEATLIFVPYYAWNNRGEGEMSVWVRQG